MGDTFLETVFLSGSILYFWVVFLAVHNCLWFLFQSPILHPVEPWYCNSEHLKYSAKYHPDFCIWNKLGYRTKLKRELGLLAHLFLVQIPHLKAGWPEQFTLSFTSVAAVLDSNVFRSLKKWTEIFKSDWSFMGISIVNAVKPA